MMKSFLPWMNWLAVLALAACAGAPSDNPQGLESTLEPPADSGQIIGEVGAPRERARVHTELASAYFERGNMGVALEELRHLIPGVQPQGAVNEKIRVKVDHSR